MNVFFFVIVHMICSVIQVSDGGVHAHINHLFSLLEGAKSLGVPSSFVQFFADGRDTSPTSGGEFTSKMPIFANDFVDLTHGC